MATEVGVTGLRQYGGFVCALGPREKSSHAFSTDGERVYPCRCGNVLVPVLFLEPEPRPLTVYGLSESLTCRPHPEQNSWVNATLTTASTEALRAWAANGEGAAATELRRREMSES